MTDLNSIVASNLGSSDADIAKMLNALTVQKTDAQRWTWAGLVLRFGAETVGQLDELLKVTPGYGWVRLLLAGGGIDFSDTHTQDSLENLRGILGSTVDTLKAIGIWHVSPWSDAGHEGEASAEGVATIRAEVRAAAARSTLEAKWAAVCNEIVNPSIATGATWADIKAAIAEVE